LVLKQNTAHKVSVMDGIVVTEPPLVNEQNTSFFTPDSQLPSPDSGPRPRYEVGDIFRLYGQDYRRGHCLTPLQLKVMRAIEVCRTAELGGHVEECSKCGHRRPVYNSCRNRHCPKCQKLATMEWLRARQAELLPVGYFHNVFTLPHELNPLAEANPRLIYRQLFRSVAHTLMSLAADPQYGLGGLPGISAVLHTWDQKLQYHIHLHCVIAGGVLALDGSRWIGVAGQQLFPVRAMAQTYRAHFLAGLQRALKRAQLVLPGPLAEPKRFAQMMEVLAGKNWICFSRPPFSHPNKMLEYLSRYTHRIALSNQRLLAIEGGEVTFSYRDRKDRNRKKELTISATEFITRFLQHVIPKGMPRMRHYGILCNRCKDEHLARCRELLGQPQVERKELPTDRVELYQHFTGCDILRCPACAQGMMEVVEKVARPWRERHQRAAVPGKVVASDTS
jgi:hypothetical protein